MRVGYGRRLYGNGGTLDSKQQRAASALACQRFEAMGIYV
jgi:hypothetical protein